MLSERSKLTELVMKAVRRVDHLVITSVPESDRILQEQTEVEQRTNVTTTGFPALDRTIPKRPRHNS
jgi:hypothetical protein